MVKDFSRRNFEVKMYKTGENLKKPFRQNANDSTLSEQFLLSQR